MPGRFLLPRGLPGLFLPIFEEVFFGNAGGKHVETPGSISVGEEVYWYFAACHVVGEIWEGHAANKDDATPVLRPFKRFIDGFGSGGGGVDGKDHRAFHAFQPVLQLFAGYLVMPYHDAFGAGKGEVHDIAFSFRGSIDPQGGKAGEPLHLIEWNVVAAVGFLEAHQVGSFFFGGPFPPSVEGGSAFHEGREVGEGVGIGGFAGGEGSLVDAEAQHLGGGSRLCHGVGTGGVH